MKRLLTACVLLIACDPQPNDLAGPIACGESTCGAGDLCVTIPSPIQPPAGYDDTECWTVPADCDVFDCDELGGDACAACVEATWYPCAGIAVDGRELFCSTN